MITYPREIFGCSFNCNKHFVCRGFNINSVGIETWKTSMTEIIPNLEKLKSKMCIKPRVQIICTSFKIRREKKKLAEGEGNL